MLTFKTQFPINPRTEMAAFIACCRTWIIGSPHTSLEALIPDGVAEGRYGDDSESATFGHFEVDGNYSGGVRYERTDSDQVRWVTDVIGHKSADSFMVSVQLNADSDLPVERLEQGKRPYVVKLIMANFVGGFDGHLPVTDNPIFLGDGDLQRAEDIICAGTDSVMPIVYLSRDASEQTIADPIALAKWVCGMAHVVVEPSRRFSSQIMRRVAGENAYGGAIAIYWPDGIGKWLFLPTKWKDRATLQSAIVRKVRGSLLYQRLRRECTWSYLQEMASRQKIDQLRASGSNNIEEYIEHFDKEISSKDEEIQRLESEIVKLKYAPLRYQPELQNGDCTLQLESGEKDLYQGEQLGLIMDALAKAAESAEPHSRRQTIFTSLISSNQNPGDRENIVGRLKDVLRQYTSLTSAARSELEDIGFDVHEDGKHYKLIFFGDERYPFTLPKTSSDHRAGLNAFSDLKRFIF